MTFLRKLALASAFILSGANAIGGEVILMGFSGNRCSIEQIARAHEQRTKDQVMVQLSASPAEVANKVKSDQLFDAVIGNMNALDVYRRAGSVADAVPFGAQEMLIVFRAGWNDTDATTEDKLRAILKNAKVISQSDPSGGGAATAVFQSIVDSLGLTDEVKNKRILTKSGEAAKPVAEGKADLGIAQSTEITGLASITNVRLAPWDTRTRGMLGIAPSAKPKHVEGANSLLDTVRSKTLAESLRNCGLRID